MNPWTGLERRAVRRFPIALPVHYRVIRPAHMDRLRKGHTVNMSSQGILITGDGQLVPKMLLEVVINWPAKLERKVSLKLVMRGRVVRVQEGSMPLVALRIAQHWFRTSK